MSLGMSKLKPQYYTTTRLLEWLKLKKDYSKCYKDTEEMDSPNIAGMNHSWQHHSTTLENSLAAS